MIIFTTLFFFFLGLCLGSFLNVWVLRTQQGRNIYDGRSECPHCLSLLGFWDLIPVISFFLLKRKCRYCKKNISWQYPLVEMATGILFATVSLLHPENFSVAELTRDLAIVFFLEFVFLYDFLSGEILNRATLIPGGLLLLCSLLFHWQTPKNIFLGILVGGGFFLFQYIVSKGKWVGGGDVRLGSFMGVILGWPHILVALFLSYVGGVIILSPFLFLKKLHKESKIPFGTILVPATFIAYFWGENLLKWWLHHF